MCTLRLWANIDPAAGALGLEHGVGDCLSRQPLMDTGHRLPAILSSPDARFLWVAVRTGRLGLEPFSKARWAERCPPLMLAGWARIGTWIGRDKQKLAAWFSPVLKLKRRFLFVFLELTLPRFPHRIGMIANTVKLVL